jgi:hypothetical protein
MQIGITVRGRFQTGERWIQCFQRFAEGLSWKIRQRISDPKGGQRVDLLANRCEPSWMTLTDADCQIEEDEITTEPRLCTREAVEAALRARTLTADQCTWLRAQEISWEIRLREGIVRLRDGSQTWELPMLLHS